MTHGHGNSYPVQASLVPHIHRHTLQETEDFDELPMRTLQLLKASKQTHPNTLPILHRLLYKNKNQLRASTTFHKITLVSRLYERLARLSPSVFLSSLLAVFVNGKPVETPWTCMPSPSFLEYGLKTSICRFRLISAIKLALLDAFRHAQQDVSKQLFVPVNLTFMAVLGEIYKEVEKDVSGLWSALYVFQRELCGIAGCDVAGYALRLNDCLDNVVVVAVKLDEAKVIVEKVAVSEEMQTVQSLVWNDKTSKPKTISRSYSSDDLETAPLPTPKKPKKRKQPKKHGNDIDNIFASLF